MNIKILIYKWSPTVRCGCMYGSIYVKNQCQSCTLGKDIHAPG
jgi:hypothetical protein